MTTAFHHNLKLVDTKKGKGIITTADIPANTVVFEFKGDIFNKANLTHDNPYYLQIGPDKYLGPSGDYDDYINHSCNPNCGLVIVGSRAFLKSLHFISYGTEITFDYSTSSTEKDDEWTMKCNCGSYHCRKNISGYHSVPEDIKNKYEKLKVIPYYLIRK